MFQAQTEANKAERYEFNCSISTRIENEPDVLENLVCSDLEGYVNTQKCRIWATENPR